MDHGSTTATAASSIVSPTTDVPRLIVKSAVPCREQPANIRVNTCRFLEKQSADTGYFVSGGSDGVVRLWNFKSATQAPLLLHQFKGAHSAGDILDVSCSTGALRIASVGLDKAVALWDVTSGDLWGRLHGHDAKINSCYFRDAVILVSGSSDCTIRLWDTRAKSSLQVLPRFKDAVTGVLFVDDFSIVGCSADGSVRTYDIRTGTAFVDQGDYPIGSASRSRNGKSILVSCVDPQKQALKLLERETGKVVKQFSGHVNATVALSTCFNHLGNIIGSGSEDGIIRFWDVSSGQTVAEIPSHDGGSNAMALGITHHNARCAFVVCGTNGLLKCYSY